MGQRQTGSIGVRRVINEFRHPRETVSIKVLALDLERTLVSDALHREPRPGLLQFLCSGCRHFERIALFTSVNREQAQSAIADLISQGHAPSELRDRIAYVRWDGRYKDLTYVPDARPDEILLIDDDEHWIHPDQKEQWIAVTEWDPYLVSGDDQELARVQHVLEQKLGLDAAP